MANNVKAFKPVFKKALKSVDPGVIEGFKNQYPASPNNYSKKINTIYGILYEHAIVRGAVINTGKLAVRTSPFDYYLPKFKCVVELDERQHFSAARLLSLITYPKNVKLGFDKDKWIDLCLSIKAVDNHPTWRDEQRAWLDTLRDLAWQDKKPTPNSKINNVVRVYEKDVLCFYKKPKELRVYLEKYFKKMISFK